MLKVSNSSSKLLASANCRVKSALEDERFLIELTVVIS